MIRNFTDHSANERTFLGAHGHCRYGFLEERFDLFLVLAAPSLAARTLWLPSQKFGNGAVLALIVFGTAIIVIAATCFLATAKAIDGNAPHRGPRFPL
jgi:uncharacterized membrane protein YidH (DUF202 family)